MAGSDQEKGSGGESAGAGSPLPVTMAELQPAQKAEQKTTKPHAADDALHSPPFVDIKSGKQGESRQYN